MALDLARKFVKAVEAENWTQCQRLARQHDLIQAELISYTFTAAAALYAEGREPARSRVFKAMWEVMEALGDERIADAIEARHDKESR